MLRDGDKAGVGLNVATGANRGRFPGPIVVSCEWTLPVAHVDIPAGVQVGLVKIFGARKVGACGIPMFEAAVFDLELEILGPPAIIVSGGPFESVLR